MERRNKKADQVRKNTRARGGEEIAEEAIAVVTTQTSDSIADNGLSYGYVNGGNALILPFHSP